MIYETVRGRPIELTVKHTGLHCQKFVVDVVGPSWNLVTALVVALTALAGAWFQQTPLYLFLVLALLLFHFNGKVHQESLLVLPELGVQIETAFATGRRSSKFIAWERIEDIVIGEAITMQRIVFYLAFLLREGELVPVFQNTLPRLNCLKKIHQSINRIFEKSTNTETVEEESR